ncbi:unnamed protein product [Caenorhabditis auriculariae]|uniref:Transcription initiation factor IIA subunit 2 n=1 Tax=Caenorhabditis auriculariae TaxID=2777116 RepID=A0A8S1HVL8_9PELO|nr:unnamed protein product [Caenorhabditis auriculariae]
MAAYAMYRNTTLGVALDQTLEDMIAEGLVPKQLASKVLTQFDKSINKMLSRLAKEKMHFRAGKLITYRYCDNVWTFILDEVEIRDPHRSFDTALSKLKIVACDGRPAGMLGTAPLARGSTASRACLAVENNSDSD